MSDTDTIEMPPIIGIAGSDAVPLTEAELRRTLDEFGQVSSVMIVALLRRVPELAVLVNAKQLKLAQQN